MLIIASMTVAATLLTTTPADNRWKQFSFLLIAVTGVVAAAVVVETQSWGVFIFLIAGLVPAVLAFIFVFWRLFEESPLAYSLWALAVVLIWVGVYLNNTKLVTLFSKSDGDSTADTFFIGLVFVSLVSVLAGTVCYWLNRRRSSPPPDGSGGRTS